MAATGVRRTAVGLTLLLALTACSHDKPKEIKVSPRPSGSPSPSAPADPATAEQQIRANWVAFFDPATKTAARQDLTQNGKLMAGALQELDGTRADATVEKVNFLSATRASVTYRLKKGGTPAPGTAVEQAGVWKVSAKTLCALAGAAPGC